MFPEYTTKITNPNNKSKTSYALRVLSLSHNQVNKYFPKKHKSNRC